MKILFWRKNEEEIKIEKSPEEQIKELKKAIRMIIKAGFWGISAIAIGMIATEIYPIPYLKYLPDISTCILAIMLGILDSKMDRKVFKEEQDKKQNEQTKEETKWESLKE